MQRVSIGPSQQWPSPFFGSNVVQEEDTLYAPEQPPAQIESNPGLIP